MPFLQYISTKSVGYKPLILYSTLLTSHNILPKGAGSCLSGRQEQPLTTKSAGIQHTITEASQSHGQIQ